MQTVKVELLGMRDEMLAEQDIPIDRLGRLRRRFFLQAKHSFVVYAIRVTHPEHGVFRRDFFGELLAARPNESLFLPLPSAFASTVEESQRTS